MNKKIYKNKNCVGQAKSTMSNPRYNMSPLVHSLTCRYRVSVKYPRPQFWFIMLNMEKCLVVNVYATGKLFLRKGKLYPNPQNGEFEE